MTVPRVILVFLGSLGEIGGPVLTLVLHKTCRHDRNTWAQQSIGMNHHTWHLQNGKFQVAWALNRPKLWTSTTPCRVWEVTAIAALHGTLSGNDLQKDEKSISDWPSSTPWTALCNETNEFGTATWQRLRWEATQTVTEMLKTILKKFLRRQHQRVCQKQNQNLPGTDMWYLLSSFDWFFAIVVSVMFHQVFTPWTCHCSQIHVLYIYISTFFRFLLQAFCWTSNKNRQYVDPKQLREGKTTISPEWNSSHFESRRILRKKRPEGCNMLKCSEPDSPRIYFISGKMRDLILHTIIAIIQRSSKSQIWFRAQIILSESSLWFQIFLGSQRSNRTFLSFSFAKSSCRALWQESQTLFWNNCGWNLTCSSRVAL